MVTIMSSHLQSRPFTLERPALRSRRSQVPICRARSDLGTANGRNIAAGGAGLAAYLAYLPRAWAEADIEIPPEVTSRISAPQLPDIKDIELPSSLPDAGGIGQFISDYPLALPLAAALVLIPLLISQVSGGGSGVQGIGAARALTVLETEDPVVLLDIRNAAEAKEQGSPDLGSIKKAAIRLPFTKAVKDEVVPDDSFLPKLGKLRQITEGVTVVLLDSSGSEASQAAKAITSLVSKVYYVQGGAESWQELGLPWKAPTKFSFDLKNLGTNIDNLAEDFKSQPTANKALIGVGAILGGALLFVTEIDTVLEVAGIFAAGNFALKNLLFADDRKRTQGDIKNLVDDKIGAKDLPKDLQRLATKVLDSEQAVEKKLGKELNKKVDEVLPEAKSAAKDVQKAAKSTADDVKEALPETKSAAEDAQRAAKSTADDVKEALPEAKSAAKDVQRAAKSTADDVKEALPETKSAAEDAQRAAKSTADDVKEALPETKSAAEDAQKAAKSTADDVKEALPEAKSAAKDAQNAAKNTADDVKEAADSASKEAGQAINAATDTVDLDGTAIASPEQKEAAVNN